MPYPYDIIEYLRLARHGGRNPKPQKTKFRYHPTLGRNRARVLDVSHLSTILTPFNNVRDEAASATNRLLTVEFSQRPSTGL